MLLYTVLSKDYPQLKEYAKKFEKDKSIDSYEFCKNQRNELYYRVKRKNNKNQIVADNYVKV